MQKELSRTPSINNKSYQESEEELTRRQANVTPTNTFSKKITDAHPPRKFKMPHLESYKGHTDSADHIEYFKSTISILDLDKTRKCKQFFTAFNESALK